MKSSPNAVFIWGFSEVLFLDNKPQWQRERALGVQVGEPVWGDQGRDLPSRASEPHRVTASLATYMGSYYGHSVGVSSVLVVQSLGGEGGINNNFAAAGTLQTTQARAHSLGVVGSCFLRRWGALDCNTQWKTFKTERKATENVMGRFTYTILPFLL